MNRKEGCPQLPKEALKDGQCEKYMIGFSKRENEKRV
jgi:hypothetical protein